MIRHLLHRSLSTLVLGAAVALATASTSARAQSAPAAPSPPPAAVGQDREDEASTSFEQGLVLAREARWAEAAVELERARAIAARPGILFNLASVRYRLGQLVESRTVLRLYFDAAREGETNYEEALRLRGVLEQDIAVLTLVLAPDSADVLVDGKPDAARGAERNLSLDPGDHSVEVHAPSYTAQTLDVRLERAARVRKEVQLQPVPPLAASAQLPESSAPTGLLSPTKRDDRQVDDDRGLLSSPLFWVAAVAVVAGGVVTALVLSGSDSTRLADPTGGTTDLKLTAPGGK